MDDAHANARAQHAHDAAEMTAIAKGDQMAFARVYRAHHPKVFRVALGVLGDREEARDVAHECFLKLHTQAPRWEAHAKVDTWLYRVALNTCLSWRRKLTRLVLTPSTSTSAAAGLDATPAPHASAHDRAEAQQRASEVRALLTSLSPRDRALVVLHVDQDLAPQEIAPLVGLSENATRVALHRALSRLRGKAAVEVTA